jgi:cyclophilin family peptidyl-prolyl cis-trans isomerase
MLRLTVVCLAMGSLAQVLPPGCLPLGEPFPDASGPPQPLVSAPLDPVTAGNTVELVASVAGDDGSISYRWYQTYGLRVALQNADNAAASFVAPQVTKEHMLRFKVDAWDLTGATGSAKAAVIITGKGESPRDDDFGTGEERDDISTPDTGTAARDQVYMVVSRGGTVLGEIVVQLYPADARRTVANFQTYINESFYRGTIFHRVAKNAEGQVMLVQGGGFLPGMEQKEPTHSPIKNESDNGLTNERGTIAMARTSDPDSATSQFYFNVVDNPDFDWKSVKQPGYAVFGRVVEGMDIVDAIAAVETHSVGGYQDVPVEDVVIIQVDYKTSGSGTTTGGDSRDGDGGDDDTSVASLSGGG